MNPEAPNKCPHCDNGPVLIHIYIKWGKGEYYFCKCLACGFEYTVVDDEVMKNE